MLLIVQIPPEGNSSKSIKLLRAERTAAFTARVRTDISAQADDLTVQSPAIVDESEPTNQIRAFDHAIAAKLLILKACTGRR
jgi:hypothetical protein